MPAGLLLSPTARTVRSGPGRSPHGVAAAGRRFPCLAGRNDQRPVWGRSRGSCPLLRHAPSVVGAAAAALSAHTGPRTALPRAHPRQGGWGKGTATGPPIPSRVPLWLPSPAWRDTHPSCPALSREYRSRCLPAPPVASDPPPVFPCRTSFAAVRPSRPFQARRLCAQPAFFQPSRHLCAKKNDFVKKNANTGLSPPSLPDKSACSPPESPPKTGPKNRKNQEITDFFRQSALTSPAKHVSVFSIAAGLQAVLGITCGVSVTFERVFFHVQVHLCWEPPLGRY